MFADNELNGDLSEDGSEMGDDGDSVDSDKVGALNLVTSNERISTNSSHLLLPAAHNNNNNNNNNNNKNGNEKPNGHGGGGHASPLNSPSTASLQAALAAVLQQAAAGPLPLDQVTRKLRLRSLLKCKAWRTCKFEHGGSS